MTSNIDLLSGGLMTVKEAAGLLGLARSYVYTLLDKGLIPYCRFGKARRIPKKALMEYAASNLTGGWADDGQAVGA